MLKKEIKRLLPEKKFNLLITAFLISKKIITKPIKSIMCIYIITRINRTLKKDNINVVFFDRMAVHYGFSQDISDNYINIGGSLAYITCDKSHTLLEKNPQNIKIFHLDKEFEIFLKFINVTLIVTPSSHFSIYSKNNKTKVAHYFHSPVSMHFVYGDYAFDAYDVFFEVGPHHTKEIKLLSESRGWKNKLSYQSGYPKIDGLSEAYAKSNTEVSKINIAFAPSWLKTSILRSHGLEIINNLVCNGFHIILRPHPHSFEYDQDILKNITKKFKSGEVVIDSSMGFDKVFTTDILISDWSGVAYEYAFSMLKPVIFIDVPNQRKIQCIENIKINTSAMEDVCRSEVGVISNSEGIVDSINFIRNIAKNDWEKKIRKARDTYLYNYGTSSKKIAYQIKELETIYASI